MTLAPNPLDDYIDKPTFCRRLGITERTADRWHTQRIGPPRTKAGRKVLYKKASIALWLERQEQAAAR